MAIICFADNYWLIATSPSELQAMTTAWMDILGRLGWHTPFDEMTYATTAEDNQYKFDIFHEGNIIQRATRKEGFKVLGTIMTFINRFDI